jgi:septum formation protein
MILASRGDGKPTLVLASASPRRADLLRQVGLDFQIWPSDGEEETRGVLPSGAEVRESKWVLDDVRRRARATALSKARPVSDAQPAAIVIAADTVVVADGVILGKPTSESDAAAMLRRLSGRTHHVITGVAVLHEQEHLALSDDVSTAVTFRALHAEEIHRYVQSGEPMDKAGAYGIQGRAALFVDRIDGDYYAVVGLPLASLARLLRAAGVSTI